jgi:pyrroloquinoline quinone (PQQ) biosynthesis protein C
MMNLLTEYDGILNQMTRELFQTKEVEGFLTTRLTRRRAQVIAQQFGLFVRHRRTAWSYLIARSPYVEARKTLLRHEAEELIRDPRCDSDHYNLWVVHGKAVGLSAEEVINAEPLPTTRAALAGWIYLAFSRPWVQALGGVSVLERINMDSIVPGGGHQTRAERRWVEDLGLSSEQLPNFRIHREADADHKSENMAMLEKYAQTEQDWNGIVEASKECFDYWRVFVGGLTHHIETVE